MGCDIHLHVEQRAYDGTWHRAEELEANPYAEYEGEPAQRYQRWYDGRNYTLFSMLANVRNGIYNGSLFGGGTGRVVEPICNPRGLPEDVSPEVKAESDGWDCDGHSHSYFTARELFAVDWTGNTMKHAGIVDPDTLYRFDRFGSLPEEWSGGISGPGIEVISADDLRAKIEALDVPTAWTVQGTPRQDRGFGGANVTAKDGKRYYALLEWEQPWLEAVGITWASLMFRLAKLAAPDGDSARIVFWFDN